MTTAKHAETLSVIRSAMGAARAVLNREFYDRSEIKAVLKELDAAMLLLPEIERPAPPLIVFDVEGGVVHAARATAAIDVIILDADTEDADEDQIFEVFGHEVYVSRHGIVDPTDDDIAYCLAVADMVADKKLLNWRRSLKVGDTVFWVDPGEGLASGTYRIVSIDTESGSVEFTHDDLIALVSEAGSEAEVYPAELHPTEPNVLFCPEKHAFWCDRDRSWGEFSKATLISPTDSIQNPVIGAITFVPTPYLKAREMATALEQPA